MQLVTDPAIFERFPGVVIGVLVAEHLKNFSPNEPVLTMLRAAEADQAKGLHGVELGTLPEVAAWRSVYRSFGSDPHDYRSSVESLLRRARAGNKPLPDINPLVNLYNAVSLTYHLPIGAEDLAKVVGDIRLGFADGSEAGVCLGADSVEMCYRGEVIYTDDKGFLCRRWNWREADRTKIEADTQKALVVLEKVPELADSQFEAAMHAMEDGVVHQLSGSCRSFVLRATELTGKLI